MATAKLVVCPRCGASVDSAVAVPGRPFECTYCGSAIAIDAPPPPRQTPQIQIVVAGPGQSSTPSAPSGGTPIVGVLIAVFVMAIVGAVTWSSLRAAGVAPTFGPTKLPATCPVNGTLKIEDQTVTLKDTAIQASLNCKVFIVRSKITAPKIIQANANAEITIEDSTLIAEDEVIDGNANVKIKISGKSLLQSEGTAIKTNMNGEIRMEGGEIRAEDTAISSNVNGKLDARNAKIVGKTALAFSMNGQATLRDTEVKGAKEMGMNGKIKEK